MKSKNYEVEIASTGKEGIIKAGMHSPDLIILDYCLPDMPAEGVIREIRQNEDKKPAFVILITAAIENIEEKAKRVEAITYLKKPFDFNALTGMIGRLFAV